MPTYKTEIYSGDVYECELYFSPRARGKEYSRAKNLNLSTSQQVEVNLRQARKKLSRLINANFTKVDVFLTLTHAGDTTPDEAKKDLARFFRRARLYRRKNGLPDQKYISVTELTNRPHHHVIISGGIPLDALMEMWERGRVIVSKLSADGEYTGLANYITKEPQEKHKKRWSQSRNLVKPKVVYKEIRSPHHELRPPKGYILLVKSMYTSELTGTTQYLKAIRSGGVDIALGKEALEEDDPSPKRGKEKCQDVKKTVKEEKSKQTKKKGGKKH